MQRGACAGEAAVFDWDNTCIFNDIGDATFRWQLDHLALALTPETLAQLLPERLGAITHLHSGIALADFKRDIQEAHRTLWPALSQGHSRTMRGSAAHRDLRAKVGALYEQMLQTPEIGAAYAYGWLARWYGGLKPAAVHQLADQAARAGQAEPIGMQTWHAASSGRTGLQTYTFRTYVSPHAEMHDLFAALGACGVPVWVVTASYAPVVQAAAALWQYAVPQDQIVGMRLQLDADGIALPQLAPDHPQTYAAGKVTAIAQAVQATPILVAGDAMTDYAMLTHSPKSCRLVVHRHTAAAELQALQAQGLAEADRDDFAGGRVLLQGRDENTGQFIASVHTRPLQQTAAESPTA
jgi:phosphoserine phosphatase